MPIGIEKPPNDGDVSPDRASETELGESSQVSQRQTGDLGTGTAAAAAKAPARASTISASGAYSRLVTNEWRESLLRRMLGAADILAVLVGALAVGFISGDNVNAFFWIVALVPAWIVLAKLLGLYDKDQRALRHLTIDEASPLAMWALLGAFGVFAVFRLGIPSTLSVISATQLALAAGVSAFVLRGLTRRLWRFTTPPERTVIIGNDAKTIRRKIELFPDVHLEIVEEIPQIGIEELREGVSRWYSVDRIVLAAKTIDTALIAELSALAQRQRIRLSVVPPNRNIFEAAVQMNRIVDLPVLEYRTWGIPRSTVFLKRALDLAMSAVGLVVLAPAAIVIAIAVKLDSRGPIIFSQTRAGQNMRPFRIRKFRTMVADAEERLQEIVPFEKLEDPMFKIRNDPRITRVGRFLRRTSLDEIPQLLNVLRGEMSLVGPRPEQLDLVERYRPEHLFRLSVKPGMTGPMQVNGRGVLTFEERLAIERAYIENLSIGSDLRILALTIGAVVSGKGAL